jgi:hypothetical protein
MTASSGSLPPAQHLGHDRRLLVDLLRVLSLRLPEQAEVNEGRAAWRSRSGRGAGLR